jgi:hypothetical protein
MANFDVILEDECGRRWIKLRSDYFNKSMKLFIALQPVEIDNIDLHLNR